MVPVLVGSRCLRVRLVSLFSGPSLVMNQRRFGYVLLALSLFPGWVGTARAARRWNLLIPFRRVDADREKNYELTTDHGPWMILAASFAGPGAEEQAQQLVYELRRDENLRAYIHRKSYDFTEPVVGLGLNRYGGPKRMRYANPVKFDELAVLVGDFSNVNDPAIERTLDRVKHAHPECLDIRRNETTTQRFIGLRELQRHFTADSRRREQGPMRNAFVTRNPLLPREYFVPSGLDPLVVEMNQDEPFSLLHNPGNFTVRVATFRGASTMDLREIERQGRGLPSRLEEAAINAHRMTEALRQRGVEAYLFHDRHESIVTIGSFASKGKPLSDGSLELNPRILQIMAEYGSEKKPLPGSSEVGVVPRQIRGIAFDVQPLPMEVPKQSVAAAYAPSNRLFR